MFGILCGIFFVDYAVEVGTHNSKFLFIDKKLGNYFGKVFISALSHDFVISRGEIKIGKGYIIDIKDYCPPLSVTFYIFYDQVTSDQGCSSELIMRTVILYYVEVRRDEFTRIKSS